MCFDCRPFSFSSTVRRVSVPSSSGHVFRLSLLLAVFKGVRVSVPSSSGHVFRLSTLLTSRYHSVSFSPLFIGACVSTQLFRAPVHLRGEVSVPSSSGHVFRHELKSAAALLGHRFQSPLHRGMCFN